MMDTQRQMRDMAHPIYEIIDIALSPVDNYSVSNHKAHTSFYILIILTGCPSRMLTSTAKLVRCVARHVMDVLLELFLSTVTPSIDQPPNSLLK